nr:conjugal transfer protein TraD [Rhizobium herbae]
MERRRRFLVTADRKREAREKFLLGGIVIRAGLTKADRAFLLGGLLELARVAPGSSEHRRLRDIGEEAFKAPSPGATETPTRETAEWH